MLFVSFAVKILCSTSKILSQKYPETSWTIYHFHTTIFVQIENRNEIPFSLCIAQINSSSNKWIKNSKTIISIKKEKTCFQMNSHNQSAKYIEFFVWPLFVSRARLAHLSNKFFLLFISVQKCNRIFIVQKRTGNDLKYNKYNLSELVDLYERKKNLKEFYFCAIIQRTFECAKIFSYA